MTQIDKPRYPATFTLTDGELQVTGSGVIEVKDLSEILNRLDKVDEYFNLASQGRSPQSWYDRRPEIAPEPQGYSGVTAFALFVLLIISFSVNVYFFGFYG